MASLFTLRALMALATRIGANPGKAISRSNISFLGKGPTKNPLFQKPFSRTRERKAREPGDPKKLFEAIDDAVGWAKDGKLNGIQTEILGHNLTGIEKVLHPPPLPVLPNITDMATRTRNLDIRDLRALRSGVDPKAPGYIRQGDPITSENFGASQFAPSEASLKARELAKREGLGRFPKESHRFFGRPLKSKDFSEIDRMIMEGKDP